MKAIIPVAGAGTRLGLHDYRQSKALIPLAGKTVLSINVDQLIRAGIGEFVFIIGYLGEKIRDYVREKYPEITSHFIFQSERRGTAHAVGLAQDITQGDEVFITLGDTICEFDMMSMLSLGYSALGVKKIDDPMSFGVAEVNVEGTVLSVVEKPSIPKSNLALVGLYKIKETAMLFESIQQVLSKKNGGMREEFYLTDALECMIRKGVIFKSFKVENWFDCGRKESLLESNATLLHKAARLMPPQDKFRDVMFIPPVSIPENCTIQNSIIGPFVTVGEKAVIHTSIVRNSIVGSNAELKDMLLDRSVIGNDTKVFGRKRSFNIGDNAELDLG